MTCLAVLLYVQEASVCVYLTWGSQKSSMWVYRSHQIWKIWVHFFFVFFCFTSSSPFETPITCMLDLSILSHRSLKLFLLLQSRVSKLDLNRFYWYVFKLSHLSFILSNPLLILCSQLFLSGIFFISRSSTGFFVDSFHVSHHILLFL